MRDPIDALRSLKRYAAVALGDGWEVRLSSEKGVFHRPYATVKQLPSMSVMLESWAVTRMIVTYQVVTFPSRMDSADESQAEAMRVANLLALAFGGPGAGTPHIRPPVDSRRAFPARVPLYDYDGVPLRGPDAFASESDRAIQDFLKFEAPPDVTVTENPDDELLWSIAANIRMSWLRSAAVASTASTTTVVVLEANEQHG